MENHKFSLRKRIRSFVFAFNGIIILFKEEHNMRIHFAAALVAVTAGIILKIEQCEWIAVTVVIALVFSAEIFNSAIERLCDMITLQNDIRIKKIKDLSALSVLISAISALVTGLIIFIPKIIDLC